MSVVENGVVTLTYQDYCQLPDDGNRHEIIDGVHLFHLPRAQSISFADATVDLKRMWSKL